MQVYSIIIECKRKIRIPWISLCIIPILTLVLLSETLRIHQKIWNYQNSKDRNMEIELYSNSSDTIDKKCKNLRILGGWFYSYYWVGPLDTWSCSSVVDDWYWFPILCSIFKIVASFMDYSVYSYNCFRYPTVILMKCSLMPMQIVMGALGNDWVST